MFDLTWVTERGLGKEREVLALKKPPKIVLNFPFLTPTGKRQRLAPVLFCQSNEKSITGIFKPRDLTFRLYSTSKRKFLKNIHKITDSCLSFSELRRERQFLQTSTGRTHY